MYIQYPLCWLPYSKATYDREIERSRDREIERSRDREIERSRDREIERSNGSGITG